METIAIGTSEGFAAVRAAVEGRLLRDIPQDELSVEFRTVRRGSWQFLGCRLGAPPARMAELSASARRSIADALGDVICVEWEPRMVRRLIRLHYDCFDDGERRRILASARGRLAEADEGRGSGISRRARVAARIKEYLDASNNIILDGFVTFRLKDYVAELEEAVDRAVDDYLLEREYEEFVHLLRHFVESQAPRVEEVQVLRRLDGRFHLVDGGARDIAVRALSGLEAGVDGSVVEGEDVLISTLVTMAPRRLHVHRLMRDHDLKDTVETIRRVFGARVRECTGCPLCRRRRAAGGVPARPRAEGGPQAT